MKFYLLGMHTARPYMPPFPGTDREAGVLADYLVDLREHRRPIPGAQEVGAAAASGPGEESVGGV